MYPGRYLRTQARFGAELVAGQGLQGSPTESGGAATEACVGHSAYEVRRAGGPGPRGRIDLRLQRSEQREIKCYKQWALYRVYRLAGFADLISKSRGPACT
eukprot:1496039-Rhodomonas_salina.2